MAGWELRQASAADAGAIAEVVVGEMQRFRGFAPEGWEPPPAAAESAELEPLLGSGRVWSLLAERGGKLVGVVSVSDARLGSQPSDEPGLAHLRHLFVAREEWGGGLARELHSAALERAREGESTEIRLFTPSGQTRARRFYERRGWQLRGTSTDRRLGLEVCEYRHILV